MTQKEALKQLQSYCAINGFALYPSSLPKQTYAIILACGDDGEITTRYPNKRISGYFTPKELLSGKALKIKFDLVSCWSR